MRKKLGRAASNSGQTGKRVFVAAALLLLGTSAFSQAVSELAQNFVEPPDSARPWVMGFALNGNLNKAGITADLEAMARVGIGGVLFMETDQGVPKGPVSFFDTEWRELFRYLLAEASRLGIAVNLHNAAGWTGSGGPWITPELSMQKVVWTETRVSGPQGIVQSIQQPETNRGFYRDIALFAYPTPSVEYRIPRVNGKSGAGTTRIEITSRADFPDLPPAAVVASDRIVNLTENMDQQGHLQWTVPDGDWTLLRMGYTTTGQENYPAPLPGRGLESDKLSKQATEIHFNALLDRLIRDNAALAGEGQTLVAAHVDSWEVGSQNWTPKFRQQFQSLRGYDPLPLLAVLSGRVVDSLEISERYLWDIRQTISDLLATNYIAHLNTLARGHGMRLTHESYDRMPAIDIAVAGQVDEPMAEFWTLEKFRKAYSLYEMSSAAHTYGKPIVGAEAFTANRDEKWQFYPGNIKDVGDWAFTEGVNRFVIHRYAFQPWTTPARLPGLGMGPWGLHYERTQTWWELSTAWHEYLARSQYLLQQGQFVADICFLTPESSPQRTHSPVKAGSLLPGGHLRPGYGFDACTPEVVSERMRVRDHRLVLPDGMNYRLLVLPMSNTMTPALLRRIRDLVRAGASVLGAPPARSPGLAGYPESDRELAELAGELWGHGPVPAELTERRVGQGRVIWGSELLRPDGLYEPKTPFDLAHWIWFMEGRPAVSAPAGKRYFRRQLQLPDDSPIASAKMVITADQSFELWINDRRVGGGSQRSLRVAEWLQPGSNLIGFVVTNDAGAPSPAGLAAALSIQFADGRVQELRTDGSWEAADHSPMAWPAGLHDDQLWSAALELGPIGIAPWGLVDQEADADDLVPDIRLAIEALRMMGIPADFQSTAPLRQIHKRIDATDIYFVANPNARDVETLARFRVRDKQAEFWWPDSGRMEPVDVFEQGANGTSIPLRLEPHGSVFVVFHPTADAPKAIPGGKNWLDLKTVQTIQGPWTLQFRPGWGAPGEVMLDKLVSWSEHENPAVRYFSGTATYRTTFAWGRGGESPDRQPRVFLDLGDVEVMARARLNGQDLGTLWKPPYRVEVSDAIRPGENRLEVEVVNLWINRLIGDEQLPEDSDRNPDGTLAEWPAWLDEMKPSPAGRFTFTSHRLWKKDDPLVPSGLIGPVSLQVE